MHLVKLAKGEIIDSQKGFVDTFNRIVDFVRNLKGDADLNNAVGCISIDRSDESHPVVRLNGTIDGSSGGAIVNGSAYPGCFELTCTSEIDDDTPAAQQAATFSISYCYYMVGATLHRISDPTSDFSVAANTDLVIYLEVDASLSGSGDAEIKTTSSLASLIAAQSDLSVSVIPLYHLRGASVLCDFRKMPIASMTDLQ